MGKRTSSGGRRVTSARAAAGTTTALEIPGQGRRITAKEVDSIDNAGVRTAVRDLMKRYNTRRVSARARDAGYRHYFGEGRTIQFFAPNGRTLTADMISESTVGAARGVGGINYAVNEYSPPLPSGTYVVDSGRFMGQPDIDITYVR